MLIAMFLALTASVAAAAQQAQPGNTAAACVAHGGGSTVKRGTICYEFFAEEIVWVDARDRCRQFNASLVSVTNEDVQIWLEAAVEQFLPGRIGVWIGLNDRRDEGTYMWDEGSGTGLEARYFNWHTGEPNDKNLGQDCIYMRKAYQWRWVDAECALPLRSYSFVCEIGPQTTGEDRNALSARARSGDVFSDSVARVTQAADPKYASPLDKEAKDKATIGNVYISKDSRNPATSAMSTSPHSEQRRITVTDGQVEEWQMQAQPAAQGLANFDSTVVSNYLWFAVLILPALVGGALLVYLRVCRNPARLATLKAAAAATLGRRNKGEATNKAPPVKDDAESKLYLLAESERQISSEAVGQQTRSNSGSGGGRAVPNIYVTFGEATAALSVRPNYGGSDDGPVYADLVEPLP